MNTPLSWYLFHWKHYQMYTGRELFRAFLAGLALGAGAVVAAVEAIR